MIKDRLQAARAVAAEWLPDALMVGGGGAVSYGAWLVFPPGGYVVAGCLLVLAGYILSRSAT